MPDEKKSTGRPLDDTGEAVRKNIRRIRDERGISAPDLSEQLSVLGRPIPPLGISRIENGQRRVDVDDLVAIAVALGVSPASLLMPMRKSDGTEVQIGDLVAIAGWHKPITARVVWAWCTASEPLISGTMLSLVQYGWPAWERDAFTARMQTETQQTRAQLYGNVPEDLRGDNGND